MKILGIESSCDETACAIVQNGREVLSNVVNSQIEIHKKFGGVVPEVASRNHIKNIHTVTLQALKEANLKLEEIDAIAVTFGAGLVGALMVGVNFAKSLAFAANKPLIAVSHIEGHIASNFISHKNLEPPFICLMVSGGHTMILRVESQTHFTVLGKSLDDACGEAFDKVARVLSLPYPGGVQVDKLAKKGKDNIVFKAKINPQLGLNFSFSGIKTAVINHINSEKMKNGEIVVENVCASFQNLVTTELATKACRACMQENLPKLVVAGGVSANSALKEKLTKMCGENKIELFMPELQYCGDNAAMIASRAFFLHQNGLGKCDLTLTAKSRL